MGELFTPPYPPRNATAAPIWAGFFGERARNSVYGWSEKAFSGWHIRRTIMGLVVHIVTHPDAVQRVLLDNADNYVKPRIVKRLIAPMIGNGLLSADGELWRAQRKIVAPAFAPGAVTALTPLMANATARLMKEWPASGTIDIAESATDATMAIIAEALFSGDPRLATPEASRHISAALIAAGQVRLSAILGLPRLGIRPEMRAGRRGLRYLRDTLTQVVRERGADGGKDDFLGQVIRDLNARFPRTEATNLAIDNAATFYLAGHETTANALTWATYLMAAQPEVQERARAEAVAALESEIATLPDRLPYLRQILDEALRLYPPAPRFDREAVADDMLGDIAIGKGDIVSIWPWLIQRHARLWDDPDAFDPDRFGPDAPARHRFQYIPFGGGPRTCVGMRFAIVEALVILAHWLAARRFVLVPGQAVMPVGSVTLRPAGALMLAVTAV